MKINTINIVKLVFAILFLAGLIFLLCTWTWATLCGLILLVKLQEHWKTVLLLVITAILSSVGGFVMLWMIHFVCTFELFVDLHSLWGIGWLFATIYALGLIIEEDQRSPYVWLWRQVKKLRHTKKMIVSY